MKLVKKFVRTRPLYDLQLLLSCLTVCHTVKPSLLAYDWDYLTIPDFIIIKQGKGYGTYRL